MVTWVEVKKFPGFVFKSQEFFVTLINISTFVNNYANNN